VKAVASTLEATHPGDYVKHRIVEANGLSVTDAAQALGVTRPALSALINGRSGLSPEMALRIEKAFGVPMDHLMQMQNSFEIAEARKREAEIKVARFRPRMRRVSKGRIS
jgi:addiction module HigA family antidote